MLVTHNPQLLASPTTYLCPKFGLILGGTDDCEVGCANEGLLYGRHVRNDDQGGI